MQKLAGEFERTAEQIKKIMDLESRSRHQNISIIGLPEGEEKRNRIHRE